MIFTKMKKAIKEAIFVSGYSRAAIELQKRTDEQLVVAGLSRKLLARGYAAYPRREEVDAQVIPDNVSTLNTAKNTAKNGTKNSATSAISLNQTPIMPKTPKAA